MNDRITFDDVEASIDEFEALLGSHGMIIPNGSRLEDASLAVKQVADAASGGGGMDPRMDHSATYRTFAGIFDFVAKALAVKDHPDFGKVAPHLRLLLDPTAGIVQNDLSPSTDASTNKLFELYIALAAMRFGTDLDLEPPAASGGHNPDVMISAHGERWGLACKAMHSTNPKTYLDRIRKGIDQIERSEATRGFVIVTLKNVVDHLSLFRVVSDEDDPVLSVLHFPSVAAAQECLIERSPFSVEAFQDGLETSELQALASGEMVEGKKSAACALEFLSAVVGVAGELTTLRTFNLRPLFNLDLSLQGADVWQLDPPEWSFLHDLNDAVHTQTFAERR